MTRAMTEESQKSIQRLIWEAEDAIPGYNRRRLTMTDLELACEAESIILVRHPLPGSAVLFQRQERPVLAVNSSLPEADQVQAGFQVWFARRLGSPGVQFCARVNTASQSPGQRAEALAELTLNPDGLAEALRDRI